MPSLFTNYTKTAVRDTRDIPQSTAIDTLSGVLNRLDQKQQKADAVKLKREIILGNDALAEQITNYQDTTDVSDDNYTEGVKQIVSDHYSQFSVKGGKSREVMDTVVNNSLSVYVSSASKYQKTQLYNRDIEDLETYGDKTKNRAFTNPNALLRLQQETIALVETSQNLTSQQQSDLKKSMNQELIGSHFKGRALRAETEEDLTQITKDLKNNSDKLPNELYEKLNSVVYSVRKKLESRDITDKQKNNTMVNKQLDNLLACSAQGNCSDEAITLDDIDYNLNLGEEERVKHREKFKAITEVTDTLVDMNNATSLKGMGDIYTTAWGKVKGDKPDTVRAFALIKNRYNALVKQIEDDPIAFAQTNNTRLKDLRQEWLTAENEQDKENIYGQMQLEIENFGKNFGTRRVMTNDEVAQFKYSLPDVVDGKTIGDFSGKLEALVKIRGANVISELIDQDVLPSAYGGLLHITNPNKRNSAILKITSSEQIDDYLNKSVGDGDTLPKYTDYRDTSLWSALNTRLAYSPNGLAEMNNIADAMVSIMKYNAVKGIKTSEEDVLNSLLSDQFQIVDDVLVTHENAENWGLVDQFKNKPEVLINALHRTNEFFTGSSLVKGGLVAGKNTSDPLNQAKGLLFDSIQSGLIDTVPHKDGIVLVNKENGFTVRNDAGETLVIPLSILGQYYNNEPFPTDGETGEPLIVPTSLYNIGGD